MKLFATHVRDKGLVSPIYRECLGIDMCKDQQSNRKMGQGYEQRSQNRKYKTAL